jgi:hypothetical protein
LTANSLNSRNMLIIGSPHGYCFKYAPSGFF